MSRKSISMFCLLLATGCTDAIPDKPNTATGDSLNPSHPETPDGKSDEIAVGNIVPDFTLQRNGKSISLNQLRADGSLTSSGIVSLTFWCTTCFSCREVEGDLDQLATKYKGRVAVFAVDANYGDSEEDVQKFAAGRNLTLPVAMDPEGNAADLFGVEMTTTTVIIDSNGVLRYRGRLLNEETTFAEQAIDSLLAAKDPVVSETEHRG